MLLGSKSPLAYLLWVIIGGTLLLNGRTVSGAEPVKFEVVADKSKVGGSDRFEVVANHCSISSGKATDRTSPSLHAVLQQRDGHQCPNCGTSQYVVNRQAGDQHSHKCSSCGTEWWHSSGISQSLKSISVPQTDPFSASSGCANGNCPTSQSVGSSRGRLFRR